MPEGNRRVERFPILFMGIIEDVFQMEGNECEDQERLKM